MFYRFNKIPCLSLDGFPFFSVPQTCYIQVICWDYINGWSYRSINIYLSISRPTANAELFDNIPFPCTNTVFSLLPDSTFVSLLPCQSNNRNAGNSVWTVHVFRPANFVLKPIPECDLVLLSRAPKDIKRLKELYIFCCMLLIFDRSNKNSFP